MRTSEAARYLGIGSKAIRALILDEVLPYVQLKPGNSPFLLDVRDLDRFIESRKRSRQYTGQFIAAHSVGKNPD
jgi:excisionase family DNA binding protein